MPSAAGTEVRVGFRPSSRHINDSKKVGTTMGHQQRINQVNMEVGEMANVNWNGGRVHGCHITARLLRGS
jgi:hypothetical protein